MTNDKSLTNESFFSARPLTQSSSIHADICCLVVSMDMPVGSAATVWFPRSYTFHFRIHGHVCWFRSNELFYKGLQPPFLYPRERLFNIQRWFASQNRNSAQKCLPFSFLETAYMSQYVIGLCPFHLIVLAT
jgi:hypothetical protein